MAQQQSEELYYQNAKKAGEVAQMLFYFLMECTWTYKMQDIRALSSEGGDLLDVEVTAAKMVESGPPGERCGGWLVRFPAKALNDTSSQLAKALLADRNSIWVFVLMHVAVKLLFQDLVNDPNEDIKELVHYLADNVYHLVRHKGSFGVMNGGRADQAYPDEEGKGVYEITLKSGHKVSLDLAGAQYNLQHQTLMHWREYWKMWGSKIKYRWGLGFHSNNHVENMASWHFLSHATVIMEINTHLNILLTQTKAELNFELKDLPGLPYAEFNKSKQCLIQRAQCWILAQAAYFNGPRTSCSAATNIPMHHPGHK